jgi:asparagine synthase (glutamine-hydrolysing)
MCDRMKAGGPDGSGLWVHEKDGVIFGHRRLAVIDLTDKGAQPMSWNEGSVWITYNGEIYNYRVLRTRLEGRGHSFLTQGDTEVILHMFREYGIDCFRQLRGMFAVAIYDAEEQKLILARDFFGIKPLYVASTADAVWFSSLVRSLLLCPGVDTSPDPAGHVGFHLWGNLPSGHTLFRGITEVPAGSAWVFDRTGKTIEKIKFFDIGAECRELVGQGETCSPEEARVRFSRAVRDAVRSHFVADVPVGLFLSAGKDSTVLLACASEVLPNPPTCVTLQFDEYTGTKIDEAPVASEVARSLGAPHQVVKVKAIEFRTERRTLLDAMDVPSVDGINTYFVSKATRAAGLKVALSGLGADELLCGYPSFVQIPRLVGFLRPVSWFPVLGRAMRIVTSAMIRGNTSPKYAGLFEYGGSFGGAYLLRRGLFMPWELPKVMDADLAREGWRQLSPVLALDESVKHVRDPELKVSLLETTVYMQSRLLRDTDWASMAHSLEVRVPFVDIELWRETVRYFATRHRMGKQDLLNVPRRPLPKSVTHRRKSGFMVPVAEWVASETAGPGAEKALRGWARIVYRELTKSGRTALCGHCT